MGDPRAFLQITRKVHGALPAHERTTGYAEFEVPLDETDLRAQASRCMDCGIPFCHRGCPLGNLIPEWNDHVYRGRSEAARVALLETNNFPEITGRVCPAPCEASCVLNLENDPVAIKDIEHAIADDILAHGLTPLPPATESGRSVAVVGSGPAGLAAAQELRRRGHRVVVFERDARAGGLLRYGIPDFKLDKSVLDRRLEQLIAEGVEIRCNTQPTADDLASFEAVVLATGARNARDLDVPGRALQGVHFAMDFLKLQNERVGGERPVEDGISAAGKHVIVLGGGDTGSDCVGTSHRHGAASVTALELMAQAPEVRADDDPWPAWPRVFRTSSSYEEGGTRLFAVQTEALLGEERVTGLRVRDVELKGGTFVPVPGTERTLPADLVLLAMGFTAVEPAPLYDALGVQVGARGRVEVTQGFATHAPRVFVCGDAYRGASLVVWAIADGRAVAKQLHAWLTASPSLQLQE